MAERIGKILEELFDSLGMQEAIAQGKVLSLWEKAVGEVVARHTWARNIKGGILVVEVEDSSWLQELLFMKEMIREKINQLVGTQVVKEIKFRLAQGR